MNTTMKALVYHGPGQLAIENRLIPQPASDEVQIRIHTVSICGSDLGAYRHASDRFAPPLVLGHEFSGDITAIGSEVTDLKPGQKVTVNPMMFCLECDFCKTGHGNLCPNRRSLGTAIGGAPTDGGMREYITVPQWMVIPVEDSVSYEAAALLEPCGVTLACAKKGHSENEKTVVVLGAGPIGLLIIKFLKALGVPNIVAVDIVDKRLEKASECGATHIYNSTSCDVLSIIKNLTNNYGADRVINAAGEMVIPLSLKLTKNGGTCILVALTHNPIEIDPMEIVGRAINFCGSYMFTTEMAEAAQLLADKKVEVEDLITASLPIEDGKKAFDMLCTPGNEHIKIQLYIK